MQTAKIGASAIVATALLFGGAGFAFAQTSTTTASTTKAVLATTSPAVVATTSPAVVATSSAVVPTPTSAPVTTTVATSTHSTVVTPGTPNTGAGGEAVMNVLLLVASALSVAMGVTYIVRQRAVR